MHFNEEEINALEQIIDMYITYEEKDYEELEKPDDHIFNKFKLLNNKLTRKKKTVIKI